MQGSGQKKKISKVEASGSSTPELQTLTSMADQLKNTEVFDE